MLAIADIGFFANMAYTRVQRKILEIRLSEVGNGAMFDFSMVTKALPQKITGIRLLADAHGRSVDVHSVHYYTSFRK
jgi:hypothetical protein